MTSWNKGWNGMVMGIGIRLGIKVNDLVGARQTIFCDWSWRR